MLGVLALVLSDVAGSPLYPPGDSLDDVVLPLALVRRPGAWQRGSAGSLGAAGPGQQQGMCRWWRALLWPRQPARLLAVCGSGRTLPLPLPLPLPQVGGTVLALLESFRAAALWDEKDADARMYPGAPRSPGPAPGPGPGPGG
jgi:hypothetical protein